MRWPLALLVTGLLLAVPAAAADGDRVVLYSVRSWQPGAAVKREDRKAAAEVVTRRCIHAGFDGVTAAVASDGEAIELRIPKAHAESEAAIAQLAERPGDVVFRIRAREKMEDEWRDKRLNAGEPPPEGYAWVPDEQSSLQALVETPEAPILAKMEKLVHEGSVQEGQRGAAFEALSAELVRVSAASVFANADIGTASVRRSMSTIGGQSMRHVAVQFEFKEERKAAFEKFTGANVGRTLCVVVEGKVQVAPVIAAAIPGAGLLRAAGTGYTDDQARDLAAVLEAGALPVKLVRAKGDTK
jgi:hypothetical protein